MNTPTANRKKGKTVQWARCFIAYNTFWGQWNGYVIPLWPCSQGRWCLALFWSYMKRTELHHFSLLRLIKMPRKPRVGFRMGLIPDGHFSKVGFLILKFSLVASWCFMSLVYKPTTRIWIQIFLSLRNSSACALAPQNNGLVWLAFTKWATVTLVR